MNPLCFSLLFGSVFLSAMAFGEPSLKEAYRGCFLIGTAVNDAHFWERDSVEVPLIKNQFDSITAENAMKWNALQPRAGEFSFEAADRFVAFGKKNGMFIVGHTLVWHSQAPDWLFKNEDGSPVNRETLLARMRDHIHTVVGRYQGRVQGWDVVNEALADDGSLRASKWLQIIGEDYIQKAFEYAHEADPKAELYYNDYGIDGGPKRDAALALLKKLRAAGAPVTGVGIQGHMNVTWPPVDVLDGTIAAFGELGLKVMISELDVDVLPSPWAEISADVNLTAESRPELNPYIDGLPSEMAEKQARRYAELFALFLKHSGVVSRVTLWGVTDRGSWLNNFPIRGRTNYPLLFDREGRPKPAFYAVLGAVKSVPVSEAEKMAPTAFRK